jgi:hypothetical protein
MFDRLVKRVALAAERRAEVRRDVLARRLSEAVPNGVRVSAEGEQVVIEGRGLVRRWVGDPALCWLMLEVRDE